MTVLLVASAGGHLAELFELAPRLELDASDATWVTADTAQSRSLLAGRDVRFVEPVPPRDLLATLRAAPAAHRILRERRWEALVTTGAAIAAAYMPLARTRGIATHYVESAARTDGPSLTGRIAERIPGVRCHAQYPGWHRRGWPCPGSVFDSFVAAPATPAPARVRSLLVTVGTTAFPFDRLVRRLDEIVPSDVEVTWQLGASTHVPSRGTAHAMLDSAQLEQAHHACDVVVAHAGIGSALMALDAGKVPVLVPREHAHGEHVDDHQAAIARHLDARGLAVAGDPARLTWAELERAASRTAARAATPPPFRLDPTDR